MDKLEVVDYNIVHKKEKEFYITIECSLENNTKVNLDLTEDDIVDILEKANNGVSLSIQKLRTLILIFAGYGWFFTIKEIKKIRKNLAKLNKLNPKNKYKKQLVEYDYILKIPNNKEQIKNDN